MEGGGMNIVTCEKEWGIWTVRVNGISVYETLGLFAAKRAYRIALLLTKALEARVSV